MTKYGLPVPVPEARTPEDFSEGGDQQALWHTFYRTDLPPKRSFVPTVGFVYETHTVDPFLERTVTLSAVANRPPQPTSVGDRSASEIEEKFAEFHAQWDRDTRFSSSLDDLIYHPSFQRIIAMGPNVVPQVLRHLGEHPVPWFYALSLLVEDDPADGVDDIDEATERWLAWGRASRLVVSS